MTLSFLESAVYSCLTVVLVLLPPIYLLFGRVSLKHIGTPFRKHRVPSLASVSNHESNDHKEGSHQWRPLKRIR